MTPVTMGKALWAAALAAVAGAAWGQAAWRPEKPVELVISTAAGGSNDQIAPLTGITPLGPSDLTPIALLLVEHTAISVRGDSPTNAESMTALVGGHIQFVASSVTAAMIQAMCRGIVR